MKLLYLITLLILINCITKEENTRYTLYASNGKDSLIYEKIVGKGNEWTEIRTYYSNQQVEKQVKNYLKRNDTVYFNFTTEGNKQFLIPFFYAGKIRDSINVGNIGTDKELFFGTFFHTISKYDKERQLFFIMRKENSSHGDEYDYIYTKDFELIKEGINFYGGNSIVYEVSCLQTE